MRFTIVILQAAIFAFALALPCFNQAATAADLKIGVATIDITAPVGYRLCGYFNERPSTGTHDPLMAKALVLRQGDASTAIVICDLIGVGSDITQAVRKAVHEQTDIPKSNITVAATHSHTGPLFGGALRNHLHDVAVAASPEKRDPRETVDYPRQLTERLVEVIVKADKVAQKRRLAVDVAKLEGLSFNRRFHMQDGAVRFNPGKLNPDIVRAAGPIDPDVGVIAVQDESGKPIAALSVFALHLDTVGGTEYSADFPYYLEQKLRTRFGSEFVSIFGNGTCGDINHINVAHDSPQGGQKEAERIGNALAEAVTSTAAISGLAESKRPRLAVRSGVAEVPLQTFTVEELAAAQRDIFKVGQRQLPFLEEVRACTIVDLHLYNQRRDGLFPLEVQAIRLDDDTAIVCLPGEVFVELGLAIKRASPFKRTMVIELCNDSPAYIPTRKAFAEGSYETVNSRVQSGGGEKMVEVAMRLLGELKKDL